RNGVGDREHVLERRVPSGPVADEDDVVVGVDDAGDDGLAFEVNTPRSAGGHVVADGGEAAALDQQLRHDAAGGVHRVDAAVDEQEVLRLPEHLSDVEAAKRERGRAPEKLPARDGVLHSDLCVYRTSLSSLISASSC